MISSMGIDAVPDLVNIFRLQPGMRVAVVGSGGKTSTLVQLARQLQRGVILTTTTHIGASQFLPDMAHYRIPTGEEFAFPWAAMKGQVSLVTGEQIDEFRSRGPAESVLAGLGNVVKENGWTMIIEGDGSRGIPLKAPAVHEPVIPLWVDMVIVSAGCSGLGKPLNAETVHRMDEYQRLAGIGMGEIITPQAAAKVLTHAQGGLKDIPPSAEKVLLLNQADDAETQSLAQQVAVLALAVYDRVIIASMHRERKPLVYARYENVAGVLLAAGASTRLGTPKQLLEKDGIPLVRRTAITGLQAGLNPLVVVSGSDAAAVEAALEGLPVQVVYNPEWQSGQGSSVAAGVKALPENAGGAVFLLSDQPYLSEPLIGRLLQEVRITCEPVIAPLASGRRANPVYFDRITFSELAQLAGEEGGRKLFAKYAPSYFEWYDERILMDLDSPQDVLHWQETADE